MAQNELTWQTKIIKKIEAEGGHGFKMQRTGVAGYPDLIACTPGRIPVMAEVKMGKCELEELQKRTHRKLKAAGFYVICICIWMDGKTVYAIQFAPEDGRQLRKVHFENVTELFWYS